MKSFFDKAAMKTSEAPEKITSGRFVTKDLQQRDAQYYAVAERNKRGTYKITIVTSNMTHERFQHRQEGLDLQQALDVLDDFDREKSADGLPRKKVHFGTGVHYLKAAEQAGLVVGMEAKALHNARLAKQIVMTRKMR